MKVVACLSWFEESPTWLASLVASMHGFVDHVVAVDGAYFLYPDALKHPVSGPEQAEAIVQTAKALGMGCTVHVPSGPWLGNETEKRTFLFQLGVRVATPFEDWLFVVDGDDVVDRVPGDARERLAASELDVAEVSLWWREDWERTARGRAATRWMASGEGMPDEWTVNHRALVRALPSLRCGFAHMIYEADRDGRTVYLRGQVDSVALPLEPAEDLTDLRVEHRHAHRNPARMRASELYYRRRTELGVEAAPVAEEQDDGIPVVPAPTPRA